MLILRSKNGDGFVCMSCIQKRNKQGLSLPLAKVAPATRPPPDDHSTATEAAAPSSAIFMDQTEAANTNFLPRHFPNKAQGVQDHSDTTVKQNIVSEPSLDVKGHTAKQGSGNVSNVNILNAPKAPAAMREHSSPSSSKVPSTHKLIDSYRPVPSSSQTDRRSLDMSRSSERLRWPPIHALREREHFLRLASPREREEYLEQNRKVICKEITCPHWLLNDCGHRYNCMYAHEDTGSYFPAPYRPGKEWTCFHWLWGSVGCRSQEADCQFSHYDTGIYTDDRGRASTKHVICLWWFKKRSCRKGHDCEFAHHHTGIVAEEPGFWRTRPGNKHDYRFSPPPGLLRQDSAPSFQRPAAGVSHSSPPLVRDTPLSPNVPTDSDSETSYEPHLLDPRTSPIPEVEKARASLHSLTQSSGGNTLPSTASEIVTGVSNHSEADKGGPHLPLFHGATPASNVKQFVQDSPPLEVHHAPAIPPSIIPKQYARRGGGVQKSSRAVDPRRRKLELTQAETSYASRDKRTERNAKAQVAPTESNAEADSHKFGISRRCKSENCTQLILSSATYCKTCGNTLKDRQVVTQKSSEPSTVSGEHEMTDLSLRSHNHPHRTSKGDRVSEPKQVDQGAAQTDMGHFLFRSLTDASLTKPISHGQKRVAAGPDIDAMFISNKRRKTDPPALLRAVTSTTSLNTVQSPGTKIAEKGLATGVRLTLEDLTELETLRKEFDMPLENQLYDDRTTLTLLRARKEDNFLQTQLEQVQAKAAEKRAAIEREKDAVAAEEAELERLREIRAKKRQLREREALEMRSLNHREVNVPDVLAGAEVSNASLQGQGGRARPTDTTASTSITNREAEFNPWPPLATSGKQSHGSPDRPSALKTRKKKSLPISIEPELGSSASPAPPAKSSKKATTTTGASPELSYASSSQDPVTSSDSPDKISSRNSGLGPKRVACEDCRNWRVSVCPNA